MSQRRRHATEPGVPPLPPGLDAYRPAEVLGSITLVVEGNGWMRRQLETDLRDLGYEARSAGTTDEAMQELRRSRVAAVFLNLDLDDDEASSLALLKRIHETHTGLPVLVLSAAQAGSAAIGRTYALGASSYFVKGQNTMVHVYSDLAARIVASRRAHASRYHFGRLTFDSQARALALKGREARLTSQQSGLILYLAQGSGPATAADLVDVGLFRPHAAPATVHSTLFTLRRKLDQLEPGLGSKFLISTSRGYALKTVV